MTPHFVAGVLWHTNSLGMRDQAVRDRKTAANFSHHARGRLDWRRLGGRRRREV